MWIFAAVAGLLAVLTGALPWHDAVDVLARVGPVLAFLVGVTVVAELADDSGLFDVAAREAARMGRGRTVRLWLLLAALGAVTTVVLSLDTTAVLLTPVVLSVAQQLEVHPLPFAMTTVWLANTASLLLPVSNLTNLLALRPLDLSEAEFAARMALPALAALVVTLLVLGLRYRRDLVGRYEVPEHPGIADRALFWTAAGVCLAIGPLILAGLGVAPVAVGGAVVLAVAYVFRRRSTLRFSLLPWRLVVLVTGLFLVVAALEQHGLSRRLQDAAGEGTGYGDLLRLSGVAATASNLVNNLPAYLALEPTADHSTDRVLALLLGTNLGPLVLLWGSLATLLWRERCRARDVEVSAKEFALVGLVGVPVLLVASVAALLVG